MLMPEHVIITLNIFIIFIILVFKYLKIQMIIMSWIRYAHCIRPSIEFLSYVDTFIYYIF